MRPGDLAVPCRHENGVATLFTHPGIGTSRKLGVWHRDEIGLVLEEEDTTFSAKHYRVLTAGGVDGWVLCYNLKVL